MTENNPPPPEFEGLEFDDYGYIKDPSKVTDSNLAKKLWSQGRITNEQINEAIAHKQLSEGLLEVEPKSADILLSRGKITEEQYEDLQEYHNSPVTWYMKTIAKQTIGGVRDATQETLETMYKLHNDFDLKTNVAKWLIGAEDRDLVLPESHHLPKVEKSESAVGQAVRGVSQFLSGFMPLYSQLNKINKGKNTVNAMVAGGTVDFVAFDEHEQRLSDLIQSVPELQNPVTEYLQSNKEDSVYEGKLKNALEGLGLGLAIDGVLLGLKAIKSNIWAKNADNEVDILANVKEVTGKTIDETPVKTEGSLKAEEPTPDENLIDSTINEVKKAIDPKIVDDVVSKASEVLEESGDVIAQAMKDNGLEMGADASKETIKKPITEMLVTAEDVEKMIEFGMKSETIDIPTQTHVVTQRLADEFGYDFNKAIFGLSKDVEYLAPRVHSAIRVLDNYTEQLKLEVKNYLDMAGNDFKPHINVALDLYDKIKFHGNLQSTVKGISANVGRALNAHKIKIGNKFVEYKHIATADKDALLRSLGGENNIHETIRAFYDVLEKGNKRDINRYTKQLSKYQLSNFIHGTWLSGILSGVGTQVANISGNTLNLVLESIEHTLAVSGRSVAGFLKGEGVDSLKHFNEISARYKGLGQGFLDAFRFMKFDENGNVISEAGTFWKAFKDNEPILDKNMKIEDNVTHSMPTYFSKGRTEREEYYKTMGAFERNLNRGVGVLGDAITLPLRFLSATDEAFKSISYKSELFRSAIEEANNRGLKGAKAKEFAKKYVEEPNVAVHNRALDVARDNTFTRAIDTTQNIGSEHKIRQTLSSVGVGVDKVASTITSMKHTPFIKHPMRFLVPFITTPLNIVKAVGRRSPLAIFSRKWQEDIIAGGTRRAQAYSKLMTGIGVAVAVSELYDRGYLTGKTPKGNEEGFKMLGIPEYSIRVGDEWVSYQRLDPITMMLGLVADVKTSFEIAEVDDEKAEKIWGMLTLSVMNNLVNKTYMKGISDFINMTTDPERYKPSDFGANLVSSLLPYSSAFQQYNNSQDPYYREAKTIDEYIRRKFSPQSLPPKLNIFGEPIKRTPKLLMAFEHNEITDDEVLREIFKVGANIGESSDKLEMEGTNIKLSLEEHNELKKLVGKTGIKDELLNLINSPQYKAIEDYEAKASLIRSYYSTALQIAKYEFIENNPEYRDKIFFNFEAKGDRLYDSEKAEAVNRKYHVIPALNKVRKELDND